VKTNFLLPKAVVGWPVEVMKMSVFLSGLNSEQKKAASQIQGPLLVLAGAGTGKTKVITTRIAHMIASGIAPEAIVAVSFTNKAAKEMQERLTHFVGATRANRATLSTFHSFALSLVREHPQLCGLQPLFGIADEGEAQALLRESLKEHKLEELVSLQAATARVSELKDKLFTEKEFETSQQAFDRALIKPLFLSYLRRLRLYNLVDFDDLVYLAALLLRDHADVRQKVQQRVQYLLVDEFQDTSTGQFALVKLLADKSRNVCAVGDDDQSIYSWRGARPEVVQDFLEQYPEAMRVTLEQNYRCAPNILAAANAVIAQNKGRLGKTLWSQQQDHGKIRLHSAENERDEALFVADSIARLKNEQGYQDADFCLLVRSNSQALAFEQVFQERKIPYHFGGGSRFFDRKEVKDLFGYLKLAHNPFDLNSFFRVVNLPTRGVGVATLEKFKARLLERKSSIEGSHAHPFDAILEEMSKEHKGIAEFSSTFLQAREKLRTAQTSLAFAQALRFAANTVGLNKEITLSSPNMQVARQRQEMMERVLEVVEKVELKNPSLESLVEALNLDDSRFDKSADTAGKVKIMSMHASKGLEFPVVFLVGLEENILPHERSLDVAHGEEEERRLFYVALTRAKHRLFLSHCGFRKKGRAGNEKEPTPSRFLEALPEELVVHSETDAGAEEARRMDAAKKLFEMFR
jgi:superfamily I DNA/RNA helicase